MHYNYIGHVERAEFNISLRNVYKLAAALDLSIGEFLEGV